MARQNTSDRDRLIGFFKNALIICGVALIITGSFLALFFAYLAYQLFINPEDLEIIQYIEGVFLSGYDRSYLVYGEMNGRPVAIKMSEQGKTFGAMLLIVLGLGIFSLTARVLIEGGSSILRVFTSPFLHEYGKKLKAAKQQPQGNQPQGQRQSQQQRPNQQRQQPNSAPREAFDKPIDPVRDETEPVNPSERPKPGSPGYRIYKS